MSIKVTDDMIEHISALAKLELSDEQRLAARVVLEKMLEQTEILNELDLDDVEPMTHIFSLQNVFCKDVIRNVNEKVAILQNAPEQKDGQFKVPKTVNLN